MAGGRALPCDRRRGRARVQLASGGHLQRRNEPGVGGRGGTNANLIRPRRQGRRGMSLPTPHAGKPGNKRRARGAWEALGYRRFVGHSAHRRSRNAEVRTAAAATGGARTTLQLDSHLWLGARARTGPGLAGDGGCGGGRCVVMLRRCAGLHRRGTGKGGGGGGAGGAAGSAETGGTGGGGPSACCS